MFLDVPKNHVWTFSTFQQILVSVSVQLGKLQLELLQVGQLQAFFEYTDE